MRGQPIVRIGAVFLCLLPFARPTRADWQTVGQIGGPTQGVAVQGHYAYLGVGLRLVILDVSDPAVLREVGVTSPFPHFVHDVAVSGTLAYVAAAGSGLRVVDISDPSRPAEVGAWSSPGYAEGVAVVGQTVYLADGPYGVRVLDVSKPSQPVEIGSAYPMNYAFKVAVEGRYAYVAAAGAGLLIADVSDPSHPVERGSLDTPGYAYGVAVAGNTVYVADGWEGLKTVNVSDPSRPHELGAYKTPGWAFGVAVSGSSAFAADAFRGLRVLNVADPGRPVEVLRSEMPGGHAWSVAVAGDKAYVADRNWGLRVVSLAPPPIPAGAGVLGPMWQSLAWLRMLVNGLPQVGSYGPFAYAHAVAVAGNYAYVAAANFGLRVVDVSDSSHPRQVSAVAIPSAVAVAVGGRYAYACGGLIEQPGSLLYVIDISDPGRPIIAGSSSVDGCRDMDVAGQIAYFATEGGLDLVNVSDPSRPFRTASLSLPQGTTVGVAVSGNKAYVAASSAGLQVVDVSDPRNPVRIGAFNTGSNASQDVVVAGNRAYVADFFRLLVVDVSDPTHPTGMGSLEVPGGNAYGVAVAGNLVYVAHGNKGLSVVDVSDPYHPLLAGTADTPGFSSAVTAFGGKVYLADGENGLVILEKAAISSGRSAERWSAQHGPMFGSTSLNLTGLFSPAAAERPQPSTSVAGVSARRQAGGTCVVNSQADAGAGTLRQCLQSVAGGDTITFDPAVFPPAHPATIALTTPLPELTRGGITIDASNAGVILDGGKTPEWTSGLVITSDGNIIKGLQILRFSFVGIEVRNAKNNQIGGDRSRGTGPQGEGNVISLNWLAGVSIHEEGAEGNVVSGNLIGTDSSGTTSAGKSGSGIVLSLGTRRNRIGGSTPGERNVVSGNGGGISLLGPTSENIVIGNFIGTDVTGTKALPNLTVGVNLMTGPSGNRIGGTDPRDRNVISGNGFGVVMQGVNTHGNSILGNYVGTDATGTIAIGNQGDGISIVGGAYHNLVQGNLSSGNRNAGVMIGDPGASYNIVSGNRVGTDVTGTKAIPNETYGVAVGWAGASFNRIGGTRPEDGNLVSGNPNGISVWGPSATGNLVLGNFIGTDITGKRALGNANDGVGLSSYSLVGGATSQEANIIASNGKGVTAGSDYNYVAGNFIGTDASGQVRMGNFGCGVVISPGERNVVQGNVIANTVSALNKGPGNGVCPDAASYTTIRRNSIHSNQGVAIAYPRGPGGILTGPVTPSPAIGIVSATGVAGTACPGCEVEIFSDAEDEGRVFEGSVTASASGLFTFTKSSPLVGPNVTATATDRQGNTSEFSAPRAVPKPQ
jgi:hypothetical protein